MSTHSAPANSAILEQISQRIHAAGGWLPFDDFMAAALYTPGLGYYSNALRKFGHMPQSGSDFVTAPELTPLFGQTVAAQVGQALMQTGTQQVWEFGAGSGALAAQLLGALGDAIAQYTIVDLSGALRARQQDALQRWAAKVQWLDHLPDALSGVVVGNEVLDAMPVKLLARLQGQWHERGVALAPDQTLCWADRQTELRPPVDVPGAHDYLTEIHPQATGFVRTLVDKLLASPQGGALFFWDYGFAQAEYYHAQRSQGTVMCHQAHLVDSNPLVDVGAKDITAHVDFTGIALAAQQAEDDALAHGGGGTKRVGVLGYTTQARFLLNCGLLTRLESASTADKALALKLISEHEMGELFKVMGIYVGQPWNAMGFAHGDRTHRL